MITKEKFDAFMEVRDGGQTNMFDVKAVAGLSGDVLAAEEVKEILNNFNTYDNEFGTGKYTE